MDMHTQPPSQLTVDGIAINILSMDEAVSAIASAARGDDSFSVCTLNLDHVAQLRRRADFRTAYRRARFVTADGFPIVALGRLAGTPIRRTTGALRPLVDAGSTNAKSIPSRSSRERIPLPLRVLKTL